MSLDRTQLQGTDEQLAARQLSVSHQRPPAELAGYASLHLIGSGAYGEVWLAVDRNTGRQVAIKFYAHRGGLDWSLLLREVEKLAFLSADRYVVQLLDVGWDAEPPYYVMEYIENGSLEDHLKTHGPMKISKAVSLFHDVATGLLHAHAKGVLHCDLKPANVLLDQDSRPRLADFGQSRLSHEQTPALGTLFYMAPEQADMEAVPDTRWDVYALGALLYCMLTGEPPYRTDDMVAKIEAGKTLDERLAYYREAIQASPPVKLLGKIPKLDRRLAEIIQRCIAVKPEERFPNVQSVVDALEQRQRRRTQRPFIALGAVGPAVLLIAMCTILAWWMNTYFNQFDRELRTRTLENNKFAARHAAEFASAGLSQSYLAAESLARLPQLHQAIAQVLDDPETKDLIAKLNQPDLEDEEREPLRQVYLAHPMVREMIETLDEITRVDHLPNFTSWMLNEPEGLQIGRTPLARTIGYNWRFRSYFTGKTEEMDRNWRPEPEERLQKTHLSEVFYSRATNRWTVAISTPILQYDTLGNERFLGVLSMTIQVGDFMPNLNDPSALDGNPEHVAVLVDGRTGLNHGQVLSHPLFHKFDSETNPLPQDFALLRVPLVEVETPQGTRVDILSKEKYSDPFADDPSGVGQEYDKSWLAELAPVMVRGVPTGWYVIVQEDYNTAIGNTLAHLKSSLTRSGLVALLMLALVVLALWAFVVRPLAQDR